MTSEELKAKVDKMKIECFDQIRTGLRMNPKLAGYESHELMALGNIKGTMKEIETLIKKWEKLNP